MGKMRRYKRKLAKAAAETIGENGAREEQSQQTNYLELAEELLSLQKDDDKMSVCSVIKSVKSSSGGESLKLKKDAKRYLKHAFLLKRLEKTQKSLSKKKKKKNANEVDDSETDEDNDDQANESKQKVLDWPVGNTNGGEKHSGPPKKHRKGFQKKQNAQLAKDLALFSKKIKIQLKNPTQNVNKV